MRHIRIPLLVIALSFMVTGMAFALDLPLITTWTTGNSCSAGCPGLTIMGFGGGGTGLGDVLIAPLYDVRPLTDPNLPGTAGTTPHVQNTLIGIVNTDPLWGVLARLRFREYKRSFECLDLDIVFTSNDVWVGQVTMGSDGKTPILNIAAGQQSRYVSVVPGGLNSILNTSLIPSSPSGLSFSATLIETSDITRCQYGYYEVIGEERIGAPNTTWQYPRLGSVVGGVYTSTACDTFNCVLGPANGTNQITGGRDVGNTLMGNTYLVRSDIAISHEFNNVAIANFSVDGAGIWFGIGAGTTRPTLAADVQGQGSNLGAGGFDNLEGLMSKRYVDFQYVDQGAQGGYDPVDTTDTPMSTSVVVTFPTKWAHYCTATPFNRLSVNACSSTATPTRAANDAGAPFTGWRESEGDYSLTTAESLPYDYGEIVKWYIYDRNEHLLTPTGCAISPCPTGTIQRLPYEVNIVGLKPLDSYSETSYDFRNNYGMATSNSTTTPAQKFFSGWVEIDMATPIGSTGDPRNLPQGKFPLTNASGTFNFYNNFFNYYRGLPAIGVVMTEFYNGAPTVNGYYGNTVPWQYGVDWIIGATAFPNANDSP